MELITTIEKCLGLPCNWKFDLELLSKYSWIEDIEYLVEWSEYEKPFDEWD